MAVAADSLLVTSDGGRHWHPGAEPAAGAGSAGAGSAGGIPPGACGGIQGTAACFATPSTGFYLAPANGRRPVLYRTADGGRSWHASGDPVPRGIAGLSACGGNALWAVTLQQTMSGQPYSIVRSGDGGRTWTEVLATAGAQPASRGSAGGPAAVTAGPGPFLAALEVTGPLTAWVVGSCDQCGRGGQLAVARTDGGTSWTVPAGTSAGQPGPVPVLATLSSASFGPASFGPAPAGWLLGWPTGASAGPTVLLATGDGAASWQQIAVFPGP
jgi:hypothetical protein